MTNEEMQKAMGFIVNQQAQFVADMGSLQEKLDGLTTVVAQLTTATLNRFEETDRKFDDVDRRISALVDSQIRTEENIRNLTAVVDRYFSDRRNGQ